MYLDSMDAMEVKYVFVEVHKMVLAWVSCRIAVNEMTKWNVLWTILQNIIQLVDENVCLLMR